MDRRRTSCRPGVHVIEAVESIGVAALFGFSVIVLAYFVVANAVYTAVHLLALVELRRLLSERTFRSVYQRFGSPFLPGVAIVVPAYNEAPTIVPSVRSFLDLTYPDYEVIVVNDGSSDATLEKLVEAFELEAVPADPPWELPCEPVRAVYRARRNEKLTVIDKENGGKADALNAGVYLTEKRLFCAVDADSIIEREALLSVAQPFLEDPERTVATGGVVRVANGCTIRRGIVEDVRLSRKPIVGLQSMEYMRAFLSGRIGLSSLRSLLIISGAFGLFDTRLVQEVGGYRSETITEDMELVVRLHRHLNEQGREYRVEFVPEPVIWTEVPEDRTVLSRQRRRWHRGLFQTLVEHRNMIGNPRYGITGVFALPFFVFVEALGPLIEGTGYVIVPLAFLLGIVDGWFFVAFLLLAIALGTFLSWLSVLSEVVSFRRYERPRDIALLLVYGIGENLVYRQWRTVVLWRGFVEFLRGVESWGSMERAGFGDDES
jgi:cellulose synthase/poly-beta-1,6-N-acetylglucosamine synthase-like glycosyltransferase